MIYEVNIMDDKEQYIYAGISTFMSGDYIGSENIENYDIVFLGVPCDYGASYRLGAKYAPRQLREYSLWDRVNGQKIYDLDFEEELTANNLKIADMGDVYVDPTHPDKNQEEIANSTYTIRKKSFPLVCGGDHSITYGSFRGIYKAMKEKKPDYEIGIIHFDAHLDVEEDYINMPAVWHGNVFRKLIDEGYLKGENLYTIGPRGVVAEQLIQYIRNKKINLYTANMIRKTGIDKVIKEIVEKNCNKKICFYISFDIDCIDMSYISGTGTPVYNGITPYQADIAFRELSELQICGFDLVELNPLVDSSKSSFVVACELIYHFLAFGCII